MSRPGTVTRVSLSEDMGRSLPDLTSREAASIVNSIIDVLSETLAGGQGIKITSFGKFYLKDKSARKGRNPQTGEEILIHARRVLGFKASESLKQSLNGVIQ